MDPDRAGKPPSYQRMTLKQKQAYARDKLAAKPDYERHALAIAGATQEWTDERVAAVLRAQREQVRDEK